VTTSHATTTHSSASGVPLDLGLLVICGTAPQSDQSHAAGGNHRDPGRGERQQRQRDSGPEQGDDDGEAPPTELAADQQGQEERRKERVESEVGGVADQVAGVYTRHRAADPGWIAGQGRAHQEVGIEPAPAAICHRPGGVDHRLAEEGASQPAPPQ